MQPARKESLRLVYNLFIYNAISVSIDFYVASEYDMTNKSINEDWLQFKFNNIE